MKPHPYDLALQQPVVRQMRPMGGGGHFAPSEIDRGVNFFVLALEALGAAPRASCEGHPTGFYIVFDAPYALALEIQRIGYMSVELTREAGVWRMDLHLNEAGIQNLAGRKFDEQEKARLLRTVATAWLAHFHTRLGPLAGVKTRKEA